ncbi:MAG: hypothetical protein AAFZ89_05445 [Bacteroidota bacterium]
MDNYSSNNSDVKKLERWSRFQLPTYFKRVGYIVSLLGVALLITKAFFDVPDWVKPVLSNMLILGLLIISLSKESIEDEFIVSLRSQSYRLAFVFGVAYAVFVLPFLNYFVDIILDTSGDASFQVSVFEVLFCMLTIQLLFFNKSKKAHQ